MGSVSGAGASESHPLHLGQMNQSPSSLSVPYVLDLQEDCIVLTFQRIDRVKARGLQTSDVVRKAIGLHARAAKVPGGEIQVVVVAVTNLPGGAIRAISLGWEERRQM